MEVNGEFQAPTTLTPGKYPPVPIAQNAGWAPDPVWTLCNREKYLAASESRTPAVQRNGWVTPAHTEVVMLGNKASLNASLAT
jgi:hypothetical protein